MEHKKVESFHDLIVWQKSHSLTTDIYKITHKFPKREHHSLAQQMRTCSSLVPINIAIGFNRRGRKNKVHYYRSALITIEEVRYCLLLSKELGYQKDVESLLDNCATIERMLQRLISSNTTPR